MKSNWRVFVGVPLLLLALFKAFGLLMLLFIEHEKPTSHFLRQGAYIVLFVAIAIALREKGSRDDVE